VEQKKVQNGCNYFPKQKAKMSTDAVLKVLNVLYIRKKEIIKRCTKEEKKREW